MNKRRIQKPNRPGVKSLSGRNPYQNLAHEIIIKAVDDWRQLIVAKAWEEKYCLKSNNFIELRQFFNSEYCELLLVGEDITPVDILRQLENELAEAKEKDLGGRSKKWMK